MTVKKEALDVTILGRQYSVCCDPGEQAALYAATSDVNAFLDAYKKKETLHSRDQFCMLAALNFANECRQLKAEKKPTNTESSNKIKALQQKIEEKLA